MVFSPYLHDVGKAQEEDVDHEGGRARSQPSHHDPWLLFKEDTSGKESMESVAVSTGFRSQISDVSICEFFPVPEISKQLVFLFYVRDFISSSRVYSPTSYFQKKAADLPRRFGYLRGQTISFFAPFWYTEKTSTMPGTVSFRTSKGPHCLGGDLMVVHCSQRHHTPVPFSRRLLEQVLPL